MSCLFSKNIRHSCARTGKTYIRNILGIRNVQRFSSSEEDEILFIQTKQTTVSPFLNHILQVPIPLRIE